MAAEAAGWLFTCVDGVAGDERGNDGERGLFVALGLVPRRLGKADLVLDADDLAASAGARHGWDPRGW